MSQSFGKEVVATLLFKRKLKDFLNNMYDTKSIEMESLFKDTYLMEKLAVQSAISYVANAISNSEFQVYKNDKLVKDDNYYHLNVEANINENSSQFWNKVITNMFLDGESIGFLHRGDIFVADSYFPNKNDLKGHKYEQITLRDSNVTFDLKAKDVFVFRNEPIDFIKIMYSVLNNYGNFFSETCNDMLNANAERWIYEVDNLGHGDENFQTKWKEKISKSLKQFMDSRKGIYPLTKGINLKQLKNENKGVTSADVINLRKDIFEIVANTFKMPLAMFTGNINNVEEVVNIFLTFCVDPVADMIGKELTRKLFLEQEILEGCYIKVDTSCVTHYDLFSIAEKADKLIADGISNIDEIRSKVNLEIKNTKWSSQHWFTKNYGKIEEILKGGDDNEK